MLYELLQLLYPDLVKFEFFLLLLEDEELLLFLDPLLLQLVFNGLYLLIPCPFCLLPLLLYLCDLLINLLNHLAGDDGRVLLRWLFGLLFILLNLCLHFFNLRLLGYVDFVILPENPLVLQQFLREMLAFFFGLG